MRQTEVELLGYVINAQGIRTDPEKVEAINRMKPPETKSEIRSFLGTYSYYRQVLPNYGAVAASLVAFTRKSTPSCGRKRVKRPLKTKGHVAVR